MNRGKRYKQPIEESWLRQKYWNENLSLPKIAKLLNCSTGRIHTAMKKYEIPTRGISSSLTGIDYGPRSLAFKKNLSEKRRGRNNPFFGKTHSEEWKIKRSKEQSGKNHPMWGKFGAEHQRWIPPEKRKTKLYMQIRTCRLYKAWRSSVYERDEYVCQACSDSSGGNLNAHHVVSLSFLVKKNSIKTLEDAIKCKALWDISNGQTLCLDCHKQTETYRHG